MEDAINAGNYAIICRCSKHIAFGSHRWEGWIYGYEDQTACGCSSPEEAKIHAINNMHDYIQRRYMLTGKIPKSYRLPKNYNYLCDYEYDVSEDEILFYPLQSRVIKISITIPTSIKASPKEITKAIERCIADGNLEIQKGNDNEDEDKIVEYVDKLKSKYCECEKYNKVNYIKTYINNIT